MGGHRLDESPFQTYGSEPEAGGQLGPSAFSTIGEMFEHECGWYLHLGMTPDEYWDGDCCAVKWYREKYLYDQEQRNFELWLQGKYVYDAMLYASPMLKPFVKDSTPQPYMEKPYPITPKEQQAQERAKKRQAMEMGLATFKAMALKINESRGGGKEDGSGT